MLLGTFFWLNTPTLSCKTWKTKTIDTFLSVKNIRLFLGQKNYCYGKICQKTRP